MTIKLKKSNLRRLTSLSALGLGALGVNTGTAQAAIVYSGIIDKRIGFGQGFGTKATISGPGGAAGVIFKLTFRGSGSSGPFYVHSVDLDGRAGGRGTRFMFLRGRFTGSSVGAFPPGARWGSPTYYKIDSRFGDIAANEGTGFNSTDHYVLFEFTGGALPHTVYGWAALSVHVGNKAGPDVTLVSWAWDTSGAQLPAGYHGQTRGPDDMSATTPTAFDATGLPALALGATGVRSWRAARESKVAIIRRRPAPPSESATAAALRC